LFDVCIGNATVGLQDAAVVDEFSDVVVPNIEALKTGDVAGNTKPV